MGANHVRVLSNLEGVELVGIADPNPIKGSLSANIYKAENVEELISQNLDYLAITTW